jgi:hypothetical protein
MDQLPTALIRSDRLMLREAYSAMPDAPVVPYVEPTPRIRRSRTAAASALHRLADRLAPARPVGGTRTVG